MTATFQAPKKLGASAPSAWRMVRLGDVADRVTKGTTPTTHGFAYTYEGVSFLRVENLQNGLVDTSKVKTYINEEAHRFFKRSALEIGDILISIAGTIGRVAIVREYDVPANTNQAVGIIRGTSQTFTPEFLRYLLESPSVHASIAGEARGGAMQNISLENVKDVELPLPPLDEQEQIVAEIEKQFTRLEAGVIALKRVQANLKRYRAAVLKAACEGKLVPTEAELAKAEGRSYETGEQLLQRILTERRKNWSGRGKYKEPAVPMTADLPEFPNGWSIASLEQLTSAVRPICYGILMPKENVASGVLFVKVKDMKGDKIDLAGLHRTTPEIAAKYARASLKTGDLLLSIRGTYGRVAEVPQELEGGNITQDTARLDVTPSIEYRYIATFLRNPDAQNYFKRVARGVAVKGVNIGDIRPMPISLPPLVQQKRIVEEVERRLSVIDELESVVKFNLQRASRLRQSILQKAFTA